MNKIIKTALGASLILSVASVSVSADIDKGQKLFVKKLKGSCGISAGAMASKHTQKGWTDINNAGKMEAEIKNICPKVKKVKAKYLPHLYDFFKEYGSDSGNTPSC